jgi:hypothetical protein
MAHGPPFCMRHGEPSVEEFWIAHPRVSQAGEWRANYGISRLPRGERRFRQERIGAAPTWGLISWPNDLIAREIRSRAVAESSGRLRTAVRPCSVSASLGFVGRLG